MSDFLKDKSVPLPKMESCLEIFKIQQRNIQKLFELKEDNVLDPKIVENKALVPFFLIYEAIKNMFKESHLLENDIELSSDKLAHIFKSVIDLPSTFVALNKNNQYNITQAIRAIVPGIERSCGAFIAGEIEKVLAGMTGALEEMLSKLQQRLD